MIDIRKSQDRGHADYDWLKTFHTFSFGQNHDSCFKGFRSLRVIDEYRVAAGKGLDWHPQDDMEIIFYVVSGILEYRNDIGDREIVTAGEILRISTGKGGRHIEYNASPNEEVHFLQIGIMPDEPNVRPEFTKASFTDVEPNSLILIASKTARYNSISIHQNIDIYATKLEKGGVVDHDVADRRGIWIQMINGELLVNGEQTIRTGDGAVLEKISHLTLVAEQNSHFLLFDMA